MKASSIFYSLIFSSKNIVNLFFILLFATVAIGGVWLFNIGQTSLIWHDKLVFSGLIIGAIILLIIFTARLSFAPIAQQQTQIDNIESKTQNNQDAILRLLEEMDALADGDLTVSATVTEEITGAIADSVNYTIDELRNLVTQINSTTIQVASAAQETQATALHLTDASDHQATQIKEVSTAINDMAESIKQVSENASQSSVVAQQSVSLSLEGNTAVKKAIDGMDTIREQIQETAKRIKRLGESSQQIGEIVELINDIAEQTNILSLNAAIQATMAGGAGRGLAVVAGEGERLGGEWR